MIVQSGGIDTSDATATAADIMTGKTAYVGNKKVTGTLKEKVYSDFVKGATALPEDVALGKIFYNDTGRQTGNAPALKTITIISDKVTTGKYGPYVDVTRYYDTNMKIKYDASGGGFTDGVTIEIPGRICFALINGEILPASACYYEDYHALVIEGSDGSCFGAGIICENEYLPIRTFVYAHYSISELPVVKIQIFYLED